MSTELCARVVGMLRILASRPLITLWNSYNRTQNTLLGSVHSELPILLGPLCLTSFFPFHFIVCKKSKGTLEEPDSQHARGHFAACQADIDFGACIGAARSVCAFRAPSLPGGAAGSQSPATGVPGQIVLHSTAVPQPSPAAWRAVLGPEKLPGGKEGLSFVSSWAFAKSPSGILF